MFKINDDWLRPEIVKDPHPYFHELRSKDPVHWNTIWKGWIITKYEDVVALAQDPRISANRLNEKVVAKMPEEGRKVAELMLNWIVLMDPPDHTRVRKVLQKAFTPRSIMKMQEYAEEVVNEALDALEGRREIDLLEDFAHNIPTNILAKMMGLPTEDFEKIKEWTRDLNKLVFIDINEPNRHKSALEGIQNMSDYLHGVFQERRKNPGDDLISALIVANENGILTEDELVAQCILLFQAGHESTANSISGSMISLLSHPEEFEKLKNNPELIHSAFEEMVRFGGWSGGVRIAKEDIEIRGKQIKKGDRVFIVYSAANRDPEVFESPDKFDILRDPNNHVGFGHGNHYCLGNQLARLEVKTSINALIAKYPNISLSKTKEIEYRPSIVTRLLKSVPVTLY